TARDSQTHVGNRRPYPVRRHPVHPGDRVRSRTVACAIEYAHGKERRALGNAVRRTADGPSDMGAVPVTIACSEAVIDRAERKHRTVSKFDMRRANAAIDHVDMARYAGERIVVRRV